MVNFHPSSGDFAELCGLLSEWTSLADRADPTGLCDLFCEGGQLSFSDSAYAGRAAIAACLAERLKAARLTRHMWANLRVDGLDRHHAHEIRCTSIQITFEQAVDQSSTQVRVSDVSDVFRREEGSPWRIRSRSMVRVMTLNANSPA